MAEFNEIVVSEEVAKKDFEKFLNARRIRPAKRKTLKDLEPIIVEAIMYGQLEIVDSEDGEYMAKQNLYDPLEAFDSILYKKRILARQSVGAMKENESSEDKTVGMIAKFSNLKAPGVVLNLSQDDFSLAAQIINYFL